MKKMMLVSLFCFVVICLCFATVSTTQKEGYSNIVELGYGIKLNANSSLRNTWIAITDDQQPVSFEGTPGVYVIYESKSSYSSSGYRFRVNYTIKPTVDITAIEVIFMTFDVFGNKMVNLRTTEIADMKAGQSYSYEPVWNCSSENDASRYLSSIAFISQIRTAEGKVYYYNPDAIANEILKFTTRFSTNDFED